MTMASVHALSEENVPDEQQSNARSENQHQYSANGNIQPGMAMPSAEYMMPPNHLEVGHTMAQVYPYADPYYGGIIPTYAGQTVVHPHLMGVLQPAVSLPSEVEPVYVNAKQYHGILRRRQSRAKAESENRLIKNRKPYLHESRHLHALKRARGCGGRFLNSKIEEYQKREDSTENTLPRDGPTSKNSCSESLRNPHVTPEMNDHDCDKKPLDDECHPSGVTV